MNKKIISVLVVLAVVLGGFGGASYLHNKRIKAEPQQSVTQEAQDAAETKDSAGEPTTMQPEEDANDPVSAEDAADPEDSSNSEGCVSDDAENFY